MIAPHVTLVEAMYKIYVEGLNPGLTLEDQHKTHADLQMQYKDAIAQARKQNPHTWNGVRDNSK